MKKGLSLTDGKILSTLMKFAIPIFLSLLLQALYGGVDLLVVGQFATTADVSGVSTGSTLLNTSTMVITGLSMGITILVGEEIGAKDPEKAGRAIGSGICLFTMIGLLFTLGVAIFAPSIATALKAPEEAFTATVHYIRICGAGGVFIVAYNVLGAIFRGIGDSRTPLLTVFIACIINIFGDLTLVEGFGMGAAGAAIATVAAQCISVLVSLYVIAKKENLPFQFSKEMVRFDWNIIGKELKLGAPVALQEVFVGTSFIVIQSVVNSFGVVSSAGVGIAEKVCAFVMLVPSAYMQSMSAFVAQNMGANKADRAKNALKYSLFTAFGVGIVMFFLLQFKGDLLSAVFSKDNAVVLASHSYLKAYAIDCLICPMMFCFTGYFNGCEKTVFVMLQGFVGAYLIRLPIVILMSHIPNVDLFHIGLGTPASSLVQIVLCIGYYFYMNKKTIKTKQLATESL